MSFEDEMLELITDQEQLRAMKKSCADFEKKLNQKVSEFFQAHLGLKDGDNFSMLDLVAKVKGR